MTFSIDMPSRKSWSNHHLVATMTDWYHEQLKKTEVSSAKSLAVDDKFLDKSLIYTKNNRDPKIDPWGMPASTGDHEDDWLFNKTLWNLFDRKLSMHFSGRPHFSEDCNL